MSEESSDEGIESEDAQSEGPSISEINDVRTSNSKNPAMMTINEKITKCDAVILHLR